MQLILTEICVYNFVMAGIVLIVALVIWRQGRVATGLMGTAATVLIAALVAALVGRVPFESLHLLCFGWFLHVPLVGAVAAARCWSNHRGWSIGGWILVCSLIGVAVDAFLIEPEWLDVTTHRIVSDKVTRPWRAVLIADLQTDRVSDYERHVFEQVRAANPDVILLAGDYLQTRSAEFPELRAALNRYLKSVGFRAPKGIFAVGGNTDESDWQEIFEGLPMTSFPETSGCDAGELHITGLSVLDSFDPELRLAENPRFHIALGHAPDFALGYVEADLLLAGHTHGGQVQLPLLGPLITLSRVPRSWASGATELDGRRTLFVSRGVGMERLGAPRLRFLCRPQLVIIDILPGDHHRPTSTALHTPQDQAR